MNTRPYPSRLIVIFLFILALWPLPAHAEIRFQETGAQLDIVNESPKKICDLFISPVTASDWGEDYLSAEEVILPGEGRSFEVKPGHYDLRLIDCEGNILLEERNIYVSADEIVLDSTDKGKECQATAEKGVRLSSIGDSTGGRRSLW